MKIHVWVWWLAAAALMAWLHLCGVSISEVNTKKNKLIKKEKYPGEREEIKEKELLKPVIVSLFLSFLRLFFSFFFIVLQFFKPSASLQ